MQVSVARLGEEARAQPALPPTGFSAQPDLTVPPNACLPLFVRLYKLFEAENQLY